ncbi:orotidine-5'-phosphate decarboxylase [Terriglobus roseus DSM 18391]|uniref:Orotidine 5'-phosphate decarboxylase n=1 Tax=Terriglobus roseus (strain DSM 18391 / NRRL B-41598 / KBS 63) TaxID=926566 RepID=I3ZG60_TERRK|nr:orotidine-5'-phosphate decarboxylase [Terriglobus roseus]AFL88228.1 orotidine-5'-phosphate decarboxylase [Terriglobus roseus DSM 18391]
MDPLDRLIVALDYPSRAEAMAFVDRLDGTVRWLKVGLELYLAEGRPMVEALRERGFEVFLDLKLHDIPNTVAGAVRSAGACGAALLTLHAAGGPAMLAAAAEAASKLASPPRLLAVTVLTSMDAAQLRAIGIEAEAREHVVRLGEMAVAAGVNGLVCSPEEIIPLRSSSAQDARLVVPGIRPAGAVKDDQSRIATAGDAIRYGADMLVVGRPITRASDPAAAAAALIEEVRAAQTA